MGVVDIFALTEHERLFTVQTDEREEDEFQASFETLQDPDTLFDFFVRNEALLRNGPFKDRELKEAVFETINEARTLMRELLSLDKMDDASFHEGLDELFEPLSLGGSDEPKKKAYGAVRKKRSSKSWVRAYAIRVEPELYVFTGSAVKLTRTMDEHSWTQEEWAKLEQCYDFLRQEWGVV